MVFAAVPLTANQPAPTYGWLQLEKKTAKELSRMAMKAPAAMSVLMYLVHRMSRSNAIVVSQSIIADGIQASRETVNKAIKHLVEHNYLEVIKAGGAHVYVVNSRVAWQGPRGARYAHFGADIVAWEEEQPAGAMDKAEPLKAVPKMVMEKDDDAA